MPDHVTEIRDIEPVQQEEHSKRDEHEPGHELAVVDVRAFLVFGHRALLESVRTSTPPISTRPRMINCLRGSAVAGVVLISMPPMIGSASLTTSQFSGTLTS